MFLTSFQSLSNANNIAQTVKLYGIIGNNSLTVLGIELVFDTGFSFQKTINFYPAEIDLCGFIQIGDGNFNEEFVENNFSEIYVTDNPLFINYNKENDSISAFFNINGKLKATEYSIITEQEILEQYCYLHVQAQVSLSCELSANSIKESLASLRKSIASGSETFNFVNTNVCLLGSDSESGVAGTNGDLTLNEIYNRNNEPAEGNNRKTKTQKAKVEILEISMLKKVTAGDDCIGKQHAPVCVLDKSMFSY